MTIVTIEGLFPPSLVSGYRSYIVSDDLWTHRYTFDTDDWADCIDLVSLQESYGVSDDDITIEHYDSLEN